MYVKCSHFIPNTWYVVGKRLPIINKLISLIAEIRIKDNKSDLDIPLRNVVGLRHYDTCC